MLAAPQEGGDGGSGVAGRTVRMYQVFMTFGPSLSIMSGGSALHIILNKLGLLWWVIVTHPVCLT